MLSVYSEAEQLTTVASHEAAKGNFDGAKEALLQARDADVGRADGYINLAELALARKDFGPAIALLYYATTIDRERGLLWARLGNALWQAERYDEAFAALEKARRFEPNHYLVYQNLGLCHYMGGDASYAEYYLKRALKLAPNNVQVRNDHAMAVLKDGRLQEGLRLFESRWEGILAKTPAWDCGLPLFFGEFEKYRGKTLLLHHEQGYGDTIQFIRFVPEIKQRFGFEHVMFAGPVALKTLLDRQCGITCYFDYGRASEMLQAAQTSHCHAPLLSAVSYLDHEYYTLPAFEPYLKAPAYYPAQRVLKPGSTKLAVGITWAASIARKSCSVLDFLPLATIPGVKLWSLQMAPHAQEAVETGADLVISDATLRVMDFADTAAIVEDLDAIVTVDTALAHLAGALGKRTFVLNPLNECWRWCRGAAPWYGSNFSLHKQSYDLSWKLAIEQIKLCLERCV